MTIVTFSLYLIDYKAPSHLLPCLYERKGTSSGNSPELRPHVNPVFQIWKSKGTEVTDEFWWTPWGQGTELCVLCAWIKVAFCVYSHWHQYDNCSYSYLFIWVEFLKITLSQMSSTICKFSFVSSVSGFT